MTSRPLFGFALALMLSFASSMPALAQNNDAPVHIGIVKYFFNDLDDTLCSIVTEPFGGLMKAATDLEGKLCFKDDAFGVARKLESGELQVAVFHAHEFAWVQSKHPKFQPLMIAVNSHREVKAHILVSKNSSAACIKDLRGKNIDLPWSTKEHCCLYLDRLCTDNTTAGAKCFFKNVAKSKSVVSAVNDVANGKMDALLVDTITLEFLKSEKGPGFFNNFIKVIAQSQDFPAPVIVVKDGGLNPATVKKLREGLESAHETAAGRDLLTMWHIDRFLPVPENYSKSLADTLERYPAPGATKVRAME